MKNSGFSPDGVNYVTVLSACAYIQSLALAKYVGGHLLKDEVKSNLFVQNSLILAYIKCGSMLDAYVIFERVAQQDIVSWSALLQGYSQHGSNSIALNVFELIHSHGLHMDKVMCVTFIRACTVLPSLERGKWGHAHIFKAGFHYNVSVANALITMYAKCGRMEDACFVFEEMATQNELLWSALILGYVQNGNGIKALELFRVMEQFQIDASKATIIAILIVCGNVGAFEWGKQMHSDLKEASLDDEIHVRNMLISMYSKCGSMANAREVFDEMSLHDVISWSSLIAGYAQHGDASEAIKLFQRMQQQGIWPDEVAIISVLTACTYVGSLDIGHYYFISINNIYGVTSAPEHLNCVIDLLGRAGHLHEARDLIDAMVFEDKCVVWVSFLANCKIFDDMGHAEHAAKELLKLDAANLTAVVLLSNIYAAAGRWNDKRNVRRLVEEYSGNRTMWSIFSLLV